MRPYQIVATERILQRIETSTNYTTARHDRGRRLRLAHDRLGQDADELQGRAAREPAARRRQGRCSSSTARTSTTRPCGSTTGSRRAPPTRTRRRACSSGSSRTRTRGSSSRRSRSSPASSTANKGHAIYDGHVVIIFDECHRSQFGDMHTAITQGVQALPPVRLHRHADLRRERRQRRATRGCAPPSRRSATGCTPTRSSTRSTTRTCCRSGIDYVNTIKLPADLADKQVSAIDTERALLAPERIGQVVGYIREHFDQKTKRSFALHARRASGSRASTRCSPPPRSTPPSATTPSSRGSRPSCPEAQRLKVGLIYTYAANEAATTTSSTRRSSRPTTWTRARATSSRRRSGLQRDVRHELRHLVGQVPELLQGPVAAAEEPRDRPRRSSSTCS